MLAEFLFYFFCAEFKSTPKTRNGLIHFIKVGGGGGKNFRRLGFPFD